jgi:hypothetical protein
LLPREIHLLEADFGQGDLAATGLAQTNSSQTDLGVVLALNSRATRPAWRRNLKLVATKAGPR